MTFTVTDSFRISISFTPSQIMRSYTHVFIVVASGDAMTYCNCALRHDSRDNSGQTVPFTNAHVSLMYLCQRSGASEHGA